MGTLPRHRPGTCHRRTERPGPEWQQLCRLGRPSAPSVPRTAAPGPAPACLPGVNQQHGPINNRDCPRGVSGRATRLGACVGCGSDEPLCSHSPAGSPSPLPPRGEGTAGAWAVRPRGCSGAPSALAAARERLTVCPGGSCAGGCSPGSSPGPGTCQARTNLPAGSRPLALVL